VSNGARFDSLLVRHLARELDRLLGGRSVRLRNLSGGTSRPRLEIAPDRHLVLDLHPLTRGVRLEAGEGEPAGGPRYRVERVHAPPDERLLRFELLGGNRFREERRALVVEFIPARENAFELDGEGRIVQAARSLRDPARRLLPGAAYQAPPPTGRLAPEDSGDEERERLRAAWSELLNPLLPGERRGAYLSGFAYAGPLNAPWVLGEDGGADPAAAFARWWELVHAPPRPVLLPPPASQPYPHPLGNDGAEPLPSLLEGFTRSALPAAPPLDSVSDPARVAAAQRRLAAARRRRESLEAELQRSGGAEQQRHQADLLLANLHRVERGAARVWLPDWEGGEVEIALDPQRSPADNADRLYAEARRLERARDRLPELIAGAAREVARRERQLEAAQAGEAQADDDAPALRSPRRSAAAENVPYRSYRTSGGLEVRVGRSARANDRLTFGHSDPRDIWMHARAVGGSHVILRWRRDEAPPARDLEEAAVLAALHSKARGSGVVAVDWTQRRHVRKPRGAAAGAVTPGRTRTLFVEPDPRVEERLRLAEE
jgi:hypothetical protein